MNFAEWVKDEVRREVAVWLAAPTLTSHRDEEKPLGVADDGDHRWPPRALIEQESPACT
jgi:hypothetical protein